MLIALNIVFYEYTEYISRSGFRRVFVAKTRILQLYARVNEYRTYDETILCVHSIIGGEEINSVQHSLWQIYLKGETIWYYVETFYLRNTSSKYKSSTKTIFVIFSVQKNHFQKLFLIIRKIFHYLYLKSILQTNVFELMPYSCLAPKTGWTTPDKMYGTSFIYCDCGL